MKTDVTCPRLNRVIVGAGYAPIGGLALALGLCLCLTGCHTGPAERPPAAPPPVTVSRPVEREVTDYADFTARTAAVDSVEIRARVSGYLEHVYFKAGALVQKDDVLFEIDPRTYQALLDQAKATAAQGEARLAYDEAEYQRNLKLVSSGAVTRSELDKSSAARGVDVADIAAAKAQVRSRELDVGFTKIAAPVTGRVSRSIVTVGNLVQAGDLTGGTLLTTIVSVDPMYAYFDVDEHTVLRVKHLIREGKAGSYEAVKIPVLLGLANEEGFPHQGTVEFIDNQVNPRTGTLKVRGVFPNKDEALSPGYFARVRVPIGEAHKTLLISERALDTDQGRKIVYIVGPDNRVVTRPVRLGALHDGLREITDGLKPGEQVIVEGLLQVRPGMTVDPNLIDMPNSQDGIARPTTVASKP
jgi:membrane fusion protein, multidrug efflux system